MLTLPRTYRWTRARYEQLAESGVLAGQRVELIGGQIVEMPPRHATLSELVRDAVLDAFPAGGCHARSAHPLALGEWDEPQPDVAVVVGNLREYLTAHPTAEQTLLVVEIADTTHGYDLGYKADVYAAARIDDYWAVLPAERQVVVCRQPAVDGSSETGWRYADRRRYSAGEKIAPLAAPDRFVSVDDLLP
jgi:Uma2 family endonuclease